MDNPPQRPPASPGATSWPINKNALLIVYPSLMVWHGWISAPVAPFRIVGIVLLALCLGLSWVAETRIVPRLGEKVAIQRPWVAAVVMWGMAAVFIVLMSLIDTAWELFDLDREAVHSQDHFRPRLGFPVSFGLKIFLGYVFWAVLRLFKFPPEPCPASAKPPRPPGMQEPVITHRWWEKYY
jgi:hypothetical protein